MGKVKIERIKLGTRSRLVDEIEPNGRAKVRNRDLPHWRDSASRGAEYIVEVVHSHCFCRC